MKNIKYIVFSALISLSFLVNAQMSAEFTYLQSDYHKGIELYEKTQYGAAIKYFENIIESELPSTSVLRTNSEYYDAICAVQLFHDDAEEKLYNFINKHPEHANIKYIYFQLGKFQYSKKQLRKTIKTFRKVDVYDLNEDEKIEYYFKYAYSNFKLENIAEAKEQFFRILNKDSKYKAPTNYYYSHIAYSEGNYQTALKGFLSLQNNETFKSVIPYYITHIYYLQENYEELLKVAPNLYDISTPKRKPEIARLIGEAYYRTGKYSKALPFLKKYHDEVNLRAKPSEEYQLAFTHFQLKQYDKAIELFKNISSGADSLAQYSNYHLAKAYLKTGNKKFALTAFKYAYKIDINPEITENALYNFAKLSYELSYNPYNQAIIAFQKYIKDYPESPKREEIMEYLSKMFLSTRNYDMALESIEEINNRSLELNKAYQRILYLKAIELFNSTKYDQSIPYFTKAISNSYTNKITAKSKYWKAEALYRTNKFQESIKLYNSFLTSAGAYSLDFYSKAYYNIGYAYFKQQKFDKALENYRLFLANKHKASEKFVNDAHQRTADCYYINKKLAKAIEHYDISIEMDVANTDYALYKKADALGGLMQYNSKTSTLNRLIREHPGSRYKGNAKYELASTFFQSINSYEEALKHYIDIIENYPKDRTYVKKAMLDIGLVYNNLGKKNEAISSLKQVSEYYKGSKESKDALRLLQDIYIELGQANEFLIYVEQLGVEVAVSEQDSILYYNAENIYMNGDCAKAKPQFESYLSQFETGAFLVDANYYLADCYFKSSEFEKALKHFEKVMELPVSGFTEDAITKSAYIYFDKKNNYSKALENYKRLLEVAEYKSNIKKAKLGILKCEFLLNNYANVFNAADEVLNMENPEKANRTLAFMLKAKSALKLGYDSLAKEMYNNVVFSTNSEASAEARYNLALIAYNGKEYDKAESYIFDIIEQEPSYKYWMAKAFILSADIFIETGNTHQAKATLQSIVENYKGDQALIDEAKAKLDAIIKAEEEAKEKEGEKESVDIKFNEEDLQLFEYDLEGGEEEIIEEEIDL